MERMPEQRTSGYGVRTSAMWWSLSLVAVLVFAGCKHEPPFAPVDEDPGNGGGGTEPPEGVVCEPNTVYFQQQVLPLLISNCTVGSGCHATAHDDNDDIQLTSYASLMNSGVIQDGDLWEAINDNDPDDRMPRPPQNPLTPEQINLIGRWIQQGAQNNSCEASGCDTLNVTYSGTIVPLIASRCQGCHSGGSPQGGLNLTSWSVLNALAADGRLGGAVQHLPGYEPMPRNAPRMNDCRVRQFMIWIEAGAPNN